MDGVSNEGRDCALAEFCDDRSATYRLIAALIDREVDAARAQVIVQMGRDMAEAARDERAQGRLRRGASAGARSDDAEGARSDERVLRARMADAARRMADEVAVFDKAAEDRLACDFARVFLAAGNTPDNDKTAVPFESVYTSESGLMMQEARDEVRAVFRAEGVMPARTEVDGEIPDDYLPFELEYLALLSERAAEALRAGSDGQARALAEKQRGFLRDHVLNWTEDLAAAVKDFEECGFYGALMDFACAFFADDARALDEMLASW